MKAYGKKTWIVPEGYIPKGSNGQAPEMTSHESISILNTSDKKANIQIYIYYTDRDPIGPYKLSVGPRRSKHIRFNDLTDPQPIPLVTEYSSLIESDIPVVVQHTRLDSRQAENALLSTIAFGTN
ncbi:sensory rhodopsin transducer [Candidatus Saccharibacteria bacterium]|nr:sensory rhodopsin transducer [Candidatus Saccharibacteria bacterium]